MSYDQTRKRWEPKVPSEQKTSLLLFFAQTNPASLDFQSSIVFYTWQVNNDYRFKKTDGRATEFGYNIEPINLGYR